MEGDTGRGAEGGRGHFSNSGCNPGSSISAILVALGISQFGYYMACNGGKWDCKTRRGRARRERTRYGRGDGRGGAASGADFPVADPIYLPKPKQVFTRRLEVVQK